MELSGRRGLIGGAVLALITACGGEEPKTTSSSGGEAGAASSTASSSGSASSSTGSMGTGGAQTDGGFTTSSSSGAGGAGQDAGLGGAGGAGGFGGADSGVDLCTPLPVLDDGNPCTVDNCDPSLGVTHIPAPLGTPCEDGDLCNGQEACDGLGACKPGLLPIIDDNDPNTLDSCDPLLGVTHTPAPPVDPTVTTTAFGAVQFLFAGPSPIQTGVVPGALSVQRTSIVRGRVNDVLGAPISGLSVSVLNHPELGATTTFADGSFTMAVAGGGPLTLRVEGQGLIEAQRTVDVPWNTWVSAGEVVLLAYDPLATAVDVGAAAMQAAQSTMSADSDGVRQATMLFPAGLSATMHLPAGGTLPLSGMLHVRATEFTVGPRGPSAMPGTLPSTSGYTYAVELSIDEAVAAGAGQVTFDKPVIVYVQNFLGFPTGTTVPVGAYDRSRGVWTPSSNGQVIQVLDVPGALADIDTDGDGLADDGSTIGVTDDERTMLASLYQPGETLWRAAITHFSSWDMNWPYGPPAGASAPFAGGGPGPGPGGGGSPSGGGGGTPPGGGAGSSASPSASNFPDDGCTQRGSIIECQTQVLGERIPLVGTPFALVYGSDRVPGRTTFRTLRVPISGATLPPGLKRIELAVDVAGKSITQAWTCPCALNVLQDVTWDGLDAFVRPVQGRQKVRVSLGYVYDGVYMTPADKANAFAALPAGTPLSITARNEIVLSKVWWGVLGAWDARASERIGGFSLDVHHTFDPVGKVLYMGNGKRRSDASIEPVMSTVAGTSAFGKDVDGLPATQSKLWNPYDVAVGPDGRVLIADYGNQRVAAVTPQGTLITLAGNGSIGFSGDGGPAVSAELNGPRGVAVGPDGSAYIGDSFNNTTVSKIWPRIRRRARGGAWHTNSARKAPSDSHNSSIKSGSSSAVGPRARRSRCTRWVC